ncbi:hypothetical protein D3C78_1754250 [compost metagenome]
MRHNRFHRQFLRQGFTLLHFKEDRGFLQPAAEIHRHQTKRTTEQERDTPAPLMHRLRRHTGVNKRRDDGAEQNPDGQARG